MKRIAFCLIVLTHLFFDCASPVSHDGGSSSEVIAVNGIIQDTSGVPSENVQVYLVPQGYYPASGLPFRTDLQDTTNADGKYTFTIPKKDTGLYNIQAVHLENRTKAFIPNITVSKDTTKILNKTLKSVGYVQVVLHDSTATESAHLYVQGTLFYKYFSTNINQINDSVIAIVLDSLPAGALSTLYYNWGNTPSNAITITDTLIIKEHDTTIIELITIDYPVIKGTIVDTEGNPISNACVSLLTQNYNAKIDGPVSDLFKDTTDVSGNYQLMGIPRGAYSLEVYDPLSKASLLKTGIGYNGDTLLIGTDTLKNPGFVKAVLPDTMDLVNGYIFFEGTSLFLDLSEIKKRYCNAVSYVLDEIPTGLTTNLYYGILRNPMKPEKIADPLKINANDTTELALVSVIYRQVTGEIVNQSGSAVAGVKVTLFPPVYNPKIDGPIPDSLIDTTDISGMYAINNIDKGDYSLQSMELGGTMMGLLENVSIHADTIVTLPIDTITNSGVLQVFMPDTINQTTGYLFLKGTTLYKDLSQASTIGLNECVLTFDAIMAETFPTVYYDIPGDAFAPQALTDTFTINSNDTTMVNANLFWAHHTRAMVGLPNDTLFDITRAPDGTMWFATTESGVLSYSNNSWTLHTASQSDIHEGGINGISLNKDGDVYVAQDSGYAYYDGNWHRLAMGVGSERVTNILDLAPDALNFIWFVTKDNGVGYREPLGSITRYTTANSGITGNDVSNILLDAQGLLWYLTNERLCQYNGIIWTFKNFQIAGNKTSYRDEIILTQSGDSWCSTEMGVHNLKIATLVYDSTDSPVLANRVTGLAEDSKENIWVSTLGGVTYFNGTDWFDHMGKRYAPLQNRVITGIGIDKQDNVWVATFGDGIIVFGPTRK